MKDLIIEEKKILKLVCYKAIKFKGTPEEICPFGFVEIVETCKNCKWFTISTMTIKGMPAVENRELKRIENMNNHASSELELSEEIKSLI